jgi:succinyl-diaminopimelate desuccinylase
MSFIDPVEFARALIRRPSVTPVDHGAIDLVESALKAMGFRTHRLRFETAEHPAIENLYARIGARGPVFCYAGHTDVVPTGPLDAWSSPPFEGRIEQGVLHGRGAADMKGGIAAFLSGLERFLARGAFDGSISLIITGDEEGPAIDGTRKVLGWMTDQGERIDHCLVGEPTSAAALGDMIKVGRRGSLNGWLTIHGRQGHVGYPERALNPVHAIARIIAALAQTPLDEGYDQFPPSSFQATRIQVDNEAVNVIPDSARAHFNIRFNPTWTGARLDAHLRAVIAALAEKEGARAELKTVISGEAFLTRDEWFRDLITRVIKARTGRDAAHSTSGGTSDARFIKDHAPVIEFGLVGATIHQIDERAPVADIAALAEIYHDLLAAYFAEKGQS